MPSIYDQLAQAYGVDKYKSNPNGVQGVDWDVGDGGYWNRDLMNRSPAGAAPTATPAAAPTASDQQTLAKAKSDAAANPRAYPFYQLNTSSSDQDMIKKFMASDTSEQEKQLNGMALVHGLSSFRGQEEGLKKNQNLIDQFMTTPKSPNYSGIMQGIDYMTDGKTHFADNYKQPMSDEERQLMSLKLNQELQKERNQFTGLDARLLQKTMLPPTLQVLTTGEKKGESGGNGGKGQRPDHFDQKEADSQAKEYYKDTKGIQDLLDQTKKVRDSINALPDTAWGTGGISGVGQKIADSIFPGSAHWNEEVAKLDQAKSQITNLEDYAKAGARGEANQGVYTRFGGMYGTLPFSNKAATLRGLEQIIAEAENHVAGATKAYPLGAPRFQGAGPGAINTQTFQQPGLKQQQPNDGLTMGPAKAKDRSKMTLKELQDEAKARGIQ